MPYEKAHALTIRSSDFSETSRIIVFYTREYGRLATLAKGVKRKYSRMIGQVDLFSYGEIVFASGRRRDRLHVLTEACAFETFLEIRTDLARLYAACHAADLISSMTAEEDPNPDLFDQVLRLLRRLEGGVGPGISLFAFEARLLALTGFMPQVAGCVVCGRDSRARAVAFSPRLGGPVCEECSPGEADLVEDVPSGVLALLGRLAADKLTRLDRVTVAAPVARQVRSFLNQYESYVLGRELRAAKHL